MKFADFDLMFFERKSELIWKRSITKQEITVVLRTTWERRDSPYIINL